MDCIQERVDPAIPDGISQKLVLPRPIPKPQLCLKKYVPSHSDVPRPQPKLRLSLKRTSEVHTSPDTISHKDLPVHSTASGDVYCGPKYAPTLSDSKLGVSNEVETGIPSPVVLQDLNDVTTCSSEVSEALFHVKRTLSHSCAVFEHSLTCDKKLHPPDKSHLNSPFLSVTSASSKSPFDKVSPVQHGSTVHWQEGEISQLLR